MVKPGDGYKDIPKGGLILDAGNAKEYKTGGWKTQRPVFDEEKCTNCHLCWVFCPDSAVIEEDGEVKGFNLDYCKGCGICAYECPVDAIKMEEE